MRKFMLSLFVLCVCCGMAFAGDVEISKIDTVFNETTPLFGPFKIDVTIKNTLNVPKKINVVCLYLGLIHPGVYFKGEPQVQKQYLEVSLKPLEERVLIFDKGFRSYHPETLGEIVVSVLGTGIIKSQEQKTAFHPEGD